MTLNKIITTAVATLVLGTTSILNASTDITNNKSTFLAYYGEVNSNGSVRTNRVNGYYKSNGTYVNSYYRS